MDKKSVNRSIIIGDVEVGITISENMDKNVVHKTNRLYWDTKGNDFLKAISLPYYGGFISEEKYQLFGDISGKTAGDRSRQRPILAISRGTQRI